jgi:hypothetical protein
MLKAGFAAEDITPGRDCTLQGYEFRFTDEPSGNDGVNDPLLARALVLRDGVAPAVIVSLDTCIVSTALARRLRQTAAEAAGTEAARVLLCCTHTHSGPAIDEPGEAYGPEASWLAKEAGADTPGRRHIEVMVAKMKLAVARAAALAYPVTVSAQEAPLGLGYCRRVPTAEGIKHNWGPAEYAELDCPPMADPACTVLAFRETGGPRTFLLWSIGVHPVTLGRTSRVVSADYPGAANRTIEHLVPGSKAMFVLGAAGNTHPWIATQDDVAGVETVGGAAGAMVALMSNGLRGGPLAEEAEGAENKGGLAIVNRTMEVAGKPLDLAVWRVGPAVIAASPTELFGELSADLRRRIGGPVVVATCANGWTGYWPTAAAFAEGKYEVDSALAAGRVAGDSEKLMDVLAEMAQSLS